MNNIVEFLSLVPLLFMCYVQMVKISVPVFQAPREDREAVGNALRQEHQLGGLLGAADAIVALWFVTALVYKHNYTVDAWHSAEALWALKFIATIWILKWCEARGFLNFKRKSDDTKNEK